MFMNAVRTQVRPSQRVQYSSQEWAKRALQLMSEQGVSPTPRHYQLWYTYASGEAPLLNRMIDNCIAHTKRVGDELSERLYLKFFGAKGENALVQETGQLMHAELDKVIARLNSAESDTTRFGNVLMEYGDDIADLADGDGIKALVSGLARETKEMEVKTRSLESELKKSSEEIKKLKANLDTARAESMIDDLTGIGNRKQFDCALKMATEDSAMSHQPLSLVFGDVDHFKKFNDTWGHKLGDHVLKLVAQQMKILIGDRGTPTRYGGEEFAIIMPDTTLSDALAFAEELRISVSKKQMKTKATGVALGRITMSFGVTQYMAGESMDAFVERADCALYAAKSAGRNKVIPADALQITAAE